jgi:thiol-disulfide isomerase/thioredoxin
MIYDQKMEDVIMKTLSLSLLAALLISIQMPSSYAEAPNFAKASSDKPADTSRAMWEECMAEKGINNEPESVADQAIYWKKRYTDLLQAFARYRVKEAQEWLKTLGRDKNLVIYAHSRSCPLCQRMKPIIAELKIELKGDVVFMGLNVDKYKSEALTLGIKNTPAYIFVKDGVKVGYEEGFVEKEDFKEDLEDVFHPELAKECDECIEECPEE